MSKVYTYMVLAVGLTLLLKFAGLPAGADGLMDFLGISFTDSSGFAAGEFVAGISALFTLGIAGSLVIGYLTQTPPESIIMGPVCAGIFTILIGTFISIVNYSAGFGFVFYIVSLIFVPLIAGFGIAMVQFWRGSD